VFLSAVLYWYAFTYWSFVHGVVSWFSENGFRVMLMYRCFYRGSVLPDCVVGN
jgi:hypothetical protein